MPDTKILKTSASETAGGNLKVEIEIADNADTAAAKLTVSLVCELEAQPQRDTQLLQEVQLRSLRRIHELIGQHIAELAPKVRKALGSSE